MVVWWKASVVVMMVVVEGVVMRRQWPSVGRSDDVGGGGGVRDPWGGCGAVVCGEVVKQAQSLARLKLLRNYVTQTMELLDSMVGSLDEEVVMAGQSLTSFVGDQCTEVHNILSQVVQDSEDDDPNQNLGLLDVIEDSESLHTSTSYRPSTSTHQSETGTRGRTEHWSHGNQGESYTEAQNSVEDASTEDGQDLQVSSSSTTRLTNKFDNYESAVQGYTSGRYVAPATTPWRQGTGSGGSGSGYGGANVGQSQAGTGHGQHSGIHTSSSRPGGRVTESGNRHGNRPQIGGSGTSESSICHGVERGNPHWIPGLDTWCADNCQVGNCPPNLCVC